MNVSNTQSAALPVTPDAQAKDQAVSNAVNNFQARYGEKPKEARVVKKALDKDDFMRIMITEMKHQDPTKPMDSDRMATQMAQVTSVEQMKNMGTALEKLADKSTASDRLAMSAMIGKTVTVDKGRFAHQKGTISPVNFDLPVDAAKIKLSILDEKGEEVATRELEPMKAGTNVYNWDGINASSIQSNTGSYIVRVDAEDAQGNKIKIDPITKETVVGVAFEGGEANFLVGDTKNPQKVAFKNVSRIEGDAMSRSQAMMAHASAVQAPASAKDSGKDQPMQSEVAGLPRGLQEKLKAEQANRAQAPEESQDPRPAPKAEGFPNGLGD